jgi:FAD-dependent urate hydroxylase
MRNDANRPILIAGAGIGGLTAAYALHKAGFAVEVFERAKAPILEAHAGLRIWSNATTVLSRLGLRDQIRAAGAPIEKLQIWTSSGLLLAEQAIDKLAQPIGLPSIGIRHSDLMRVLWDACHDIPIHYDSHCVAYSPGEDGVVLRMEGGQDARGQIVIGADGARSAIRAQMVGDGSPAYSGFTFWRGISEGADDLEKGTVYTVWGTHDVHAGCWFVDDHHVAWFIRAAATAGKHDMPDAAKARLLEVAQPMHGPLAHLLDRTPAEGISRTDIYVRERVAFLRTDPVALLGDAAHAMPNVLGQGVSQTIEDGMVLAQSLAEASEPMDGLAHYEAHRLSRVKWVREQVYRFNRVEGAEHPLLLWVRNKVSQLIGSDSSKNMWRELVTFPD